MRYVYPVVIESDEDARYVATAPDVPEAITDGATRQEALKEMSEALGAALAGYVLEGRELPQPSKARRGQYLVPVAPLVAAKLALRAAMREEGVSNVALASRLGVSEAAVRRLVDPDHASRLDGVVAALSVLGRGLIIEDQKQVPA
jgi:antitoxin HicB